MDEENKLNIGEDSVVIGNVKGNVGNRSVFIGATDSNGNTTLNQPMAVGYNAKAGPGSIAIGSNAMAGPDIFFLLNTLESMASKEGNSVSEIKDLATILRTPIPDKNKIQSLWEIINSFKWTAETGILIYQISALIAKL